MPRPRVNIGPFDPRVKGSRPEELGDHGRVRLDIRGAQDAIQHIQNQLPRLRAIHQQRVAAGDPEGGRLDVVAAEEGIRINQERLRQAQARLRGLGQQQVPEGDTGRALAPDQARQLGGAQFRPLMDGPDPGFQPTPEGPGAAPLTPEQEAFLRQLGVDTSQFGVRAVDPGTGTFTGQNFPGRTPQTQEDLEGLAQRVGFSDLGGLPPLKNPFRDPIRTFTNEALGINEVFDPLKHGPPTSVNEIPITRRTINTLRQRTPPMFEFDAQLGPTGLPLPGQPEIAPGALVVADPSAPGGVRLATNEEIANARLIADLEESVVDLQTRDFEFRGEAANTLNQQLFDERAAQVEFEREFALQTVADQTAANQINLRADRELEQLRIEQSEARFTQQLQQQFNLQLLDREALLAEQRAENQRSFQAQQSALDRQLQRLELEEASRSARAIEELRIQELNLERQQFQMQVFTTFALQPEMLLFLGQSGLEALFEDALGSELSQVFKDLQQRIQERPPINIQQFARLSAAEQQQERFTTAARTGTRDVETELRGEAPLATRNRQPLSQDIEPGRGSRNFAPIRVG